MCDVCLPSNMRQTFLIGSKQLLAHSGQLCLLSSTSRKVNFFHFSASSSAASCAFLGLRQILWFIASRLNNSTITITFVVIYKLCASHTQAERRVCVCVGLFVLMLNGF